MHLENVTPWELLLKKMTWEQLEQINVHHKKVLDFGSGNGMTANYFAGDNEVIAVEPDEKVLAGRFRDNDYTQLKGDSKVLEKFADESFDVILCHNVLEYVTDRDVVLKEFSRILKKNGNLSVIKHNRAGRIMQMAVLLNAFKYANELLDSSGPSVQQPGAVNYYADSNLEKWSQDFVIEKTLGMRAFWDLQQNQDVQKDKKWQEEMLRLEMKVSDMEEYKAIASFHHLIMRKK